MILWSLSDIQPDRFVPEVNKVTKIKEISSTAAIWSMFYKFGAPLSPRVYTVLQVTHLDTTSPKTGYFTHQCRV